MTISEMNTKMRNIADKLLTTRILDDKLIKEALQELHAITRVLTDEYGASERYLVNHAAQQAMFMVKDARNALKQALRQLRSSNCNKAAKKLYTAIEYTQTLGGGV